MLWRLVAKLLFKACLPLVAIAGVLTYGVYLRGGDPAALWKSVAGRGLSQFDAMIAGVKGDTSRAVDSIAGGVDSLATDRQGDGLTAVFTWQDADGVTHYSSSRPTGVEAGTVTVDPNTNVLAPVRAPQVEQDTGNGSVPGTATELDGQLPGVAGQVLATRKPERSSPGDGDGALPGVDPAQLLRMLQSAEQ